MGSREVTVRLRADIAAFQKSFAEASLSAKALERNLDGGDKSLGRFEQSSKKTGNEVDNLSGRLTILRDAAILAGPPLIEVGAEATPLIAGLAAEFGVAALAAGTAVLAFQGVGDALKAVNTAHLDPTVENLQKAHDAMVMLAPDAQGLVKQLREMQPTLDGLSASAATGFFPGLTAGLKDLQTVAPKVDEILFKTGQTLGSLAEQGAHALAGPEWAGFIDFIEREGPPTLAALGHSIGSVTHGLAELVMAGAPLEHMGSGWLTNASDAFDKWATGLSKTQGFQQFVSYLQEHGPEVGKAVEAIANALLQIVQASSGLGGPTLRAITAVANVIAKLADSKAGPAILATASALAILSRAQSAWNATNKSQPWIGATRGADGLTAKLTAARAPLIKGGLAAAGFGLAISGAADKSWLLNTASLGLMGSIAGPWGAALGAGVGVLEHFAGGQKDAVTDTASLTSTLDQQTGAITQNTGAYVAQQFASSGVLKQAQALGLSLSDVTQAALGNQDALGRVNGQMATQQAGLKGNAEGLNAFADAWGPVRDAINDTNGQLTSGQSKLHLISEATDGYGNSMLASAQAAQQQAKAINTATQAMRDQHDAAVSAFDAETQYREAVVAATAQAKKSDDGIKGSSDAALKNRETLSALATAWNAQSTAVKNNTDKFKEAKANFIATAEAMHVPEAAAKALADQLMQIPRSTVVKVQAETAQAQAAIAIVGTDLRNLHDRNLYIRVHTLRTGGDPGLADAHGGTSYASGGFTGRGGRNEVAGVVHRGEVVVPQDLVRRDWGMLSSRYGNLPGFAGGGYVGDGWLGRVPAGGGSGSMSDLDHQAHGAADGLKSLKERLADAAKAIDKEKAARQNLIQSEHDFESAVGAVYSKADLFAGGLSDFDTGAQANTNDTNAAAAALAQAKANGLSGSLYQALAGSGNLLLDQQFAALTPAQIAQREQEFAAQNNAQNLLGVQAGKDAGFPALIKAQTDKLDKVEKTVKALDATIKTLGSKVQDGAEKGTRAGVHDVAVKTRNRVRTGG